MKQSVTDSYDLKRNIISTVVSTLAAVLVAVPVALGIVGSRVESSPKTQNIVPTVSPTVLPATQTSTGGNSCDIPSANQASSAVSGSATATHNAGGHHKVLITKNSYTFNKTNTVHNGSPTNHESISNGNNTNFGHDNDLVDADDSVDVNAPVDAHILNNVLNDSLNDNALDLDVLSSIL